MNRLLTPTRLISIGIFGFLTAAPAMAQSESVTMPIEGAVVSTCRVSAAPMHFGTVTGLSGRPTTTATVSLTCNPNVDYAIAIDAGQHTRGRRARRMFNTAANRYMRYNIYSNAALTQRWDDRRRWQVTGNTGAAGTATHTAYGQIRSLANLATTGQYRDTVTITVEF